MKPFKILIVLTAFIYSLGINAQQYVDADPVLTHNENPVNVLRLNSSDYNWFEKLQIKNGLLNSYNGLTYIGEATMEYNCHFYAWSKTEQYPGLRRWMNDPSVDWLDYSYVSSYLPTQPAKVTYSKSNGSLGHSAITTSQSDRYISKWGPACLFEHDYDECPYWDQGYQVRKYYPRFNIAGPSIINCSTSSFTIPNTTGEGYSISWVSNANLSIYTYTNWICSVSSSSTGNGTLTAIVNKPGFYPAHNETKNVMVYSGLPASPTSLSVIGNLCSYSMIAFDAIDTQNPAGTAYYWEVTGNGELLYGQGSASISVLTSDPGNITVSVWAYNGCGYSISYYGQDFLIDDDCGGGGIQFSISPNPANNQIIVATNIEPSRDSYIDIYDQRFLKKLRFPINSKDQTFDISSLHTGIYYIILSNNGNKSTKLFIKN